MARPPPLKRSAVPLRWSAVRNISEFVPPDRQRESKPDREKSEQPEALLLSLSGAVEGALKKSKRELILCSTSSRATDVFFFFFFFPRNDDLTLRFSFPLRFACSRAVFSLREKTQRARARLSAQRRVGAKARKEHVRTGAPSVKFISRSHFDARSLGPRRCGAAPAEPLVSVFLSQRSRLPESARVLPRGRV